MVPSISFSGRECRHADKIFAFPARTEFSVTTGNNTFGSMGARPWVRQTAHEPVRDLIRFLEKFSGAKRTLTIRPYHGDKSGESLALNSVRTRKTQREGERPSRELRLGTKRQERNLHFDLQACRNPATAMEHYSTISVARIGRSLVPGIGLGD
jgi:hypothetical protein